MLFCDILLRRCLFFGAGVMDFYEKVKNYILKNELISEGDNVILGVSGGADSVALFRILVRLKDEIDFRLSAVHIHHGIRKKSANKDEKFVKNLCEKYKVELKVFHKDIPLISKITKESEEECGRRIRYEIFEDLALQEDNSKIAVAHHINDQVETIVFRMLRGSGVKGLSGMEVKRDNIIRPFLCAKKYEILEYLGSISQKYREDETNENTQYSRNYIRMKILPKFEKIRDNSLDHIISLSKEAAEVNDFMEKKAKELLLEAAAEANRNYLIKDSYLRYKTETILAAEPVLARTAVRMMIDEAGVSLKNVSRTHIEKIFKLLEKSESSEVHLPQGVKVILENGVVYVNIKRSQETFDKVLEEAQALEKYARVEAAVALADAEKEDTAVLVRTEKEELGFFFEVTDNGEYVLPCGITVRSKILTEFDMDNIPMDTNVKWVDYDKLEDGLCLRTRKIGDYLVINKRGDEGNLKNYMINEKIPKSERNMIPIVASGAKVYWVVGHRISEDVKVTEQTTRVLELSFENENDTENGNNEEEFSNG